MYREDAQAICCTKLNVKFSCGDERPSGHKTRQREPFDRKPKEEGIESTGGTAARHSSNRRNRNRIRRKLTRDIYKMERQEDVSGGRREIEICSLREQLKAYQRPPRHKGISKGEECRWKRRKGAPTGRAQRQRWKGVVIHSACMVHHVTVLRKARGQQYGVVSDGRKFHGLCRHHWGRARYRRREMLEETTDYL